MGKVMNECWLIKEMRQLHAGTARAGSTDNNADTVKNLQFKNDWLSVLDSVEDFHYDFLEVPLFFRRYSMRLNARMLSSSVDSWFLNKTDLGLTQSSTLIDKYSTVGMMIMMKDVIETVLKYGLDPALPRDGHPEMLKNNWEDLSILRTYLE